MLKKNISIGIVVLFTFIYGNLFAAEKSPQLTFEEKHKDKNIIYLLYDYSVTLNEDWSYVTKIHKRIKILKESAKSYGEIPLPYESDREKIINIDAFTITPDGKKHRYSKIQDLKVYNEYPMYSDSVIKVITLPEVNVGSILEYEVTYMTERELIKDAFWDTLDLNFESPAKEVNYSVIFPKKLNITCKEFNLKYKPVIKEAGSTVTYSWRIQNIDPQEKAEEHLPLDTPGSIENIIEFSSIKSWDDIASWYSNLIQKNLVIDKNIEQTAKKLIDGQAATKDKVRTTLEYIQDNFRYVSMSFGDNSLEPHPTDEVFKNKYGDCKDLSLLCMAMLKVEGIKSYLAFFNNEFSITDPKYDLPSPAPFNHVILVVEDKENGDFYADPLLNGYDIGQFPKAYQGAYTFIINENGGRFERFPIFDEKRNSAKKEETTTIYPDGSALVEVMKTWELDSSVKMREKIKNLDQEGKDRFYEILDADIASGGEMIERHIEGLDQRYGSMKGYAKYKSQNLYPPTGDIIVIDVLGYERGDDFTKKERKNPIFYTTNSLSEEVSTYRLPKGYDICYIPKNLDMDIGIFALKREYTKKQNEITITEIVRSKRYQFPKEDYKKLKDFFDQLPGNSAQRIVLKKTNPF